CVRDARRAPRPLRRLRRDRPLRSRRGPVRVRHMTEATTTATSAVSVHLARPSEPAEVHRTGGQGRTIWLTGLPSAGKSTIAEIVAARLREQGERVEILDGDIVRQYLSKGLGFSKEDRDENIRRIGFVASLLARNGVKIIVAAISPYRDVRDEVR